jgi:hypothetical protein
MALTDDKTRSESDGFTGSCAGGAADARAIRQDGAFHCTSAHIAHQDYVPHSLIPLYIEPVYIWCTPGVRLMISSLRVEDTMVEPAGCGIWIDPQLVLQRQRAAPVLLHRAVPPAGTGIVAHEGAVCDFEGGVKTQQVLGHLDRPLERSLARQHLDPAL